MTFHAIHRITPATHPRRARCDTAGCNFPAARRAVLACSSGCQPREWGLCAFHDNASVRPRCGQCGRTQAELVVTL